ncbi:MAG: hypothetical protein HY960_08210 [Ignavibacteriae bacterium]|nr:hypothetical protein [Ignavibacteriota bacterium]
MEIHSHSNDTLEQFLTAERLKPLQAIHLALGTSPVTFGFIIILLAQTAENLPSQNSELIQTLSFITLLLCTIAYSSFPFVNKIFNAKFQSVETKNVVEQRFKILVTKKIITVASFEMPAMFGLVVCLLGVLDGSFSSYPEFLLNIVPAFILIVYIALTFPSRERIVDELKLSGQ